MRSSFAIARANGYEMFALYAQYCLGPVDTAPTARRTASEVVKTLATHASPDPSRRHGYTMTFDSTCTYLALTRVWDNCTGGRRYLMSSSSLVKRP